MKNVENVTKQICKNKCKNETKMKILKCEKIEKIEIVKKQNRKK